MKPEIKLDKDFTPELCRESVGSTITYGAGQNFEGIYKFAHEHGYMVCGCPIGSRPKHLAQSC